MKREKRPARRGELTPLTPADREKLQVASPAQAKLEDMSSELIQAVSRAGDDLQRYYVRLARAAEGGGAQGAAGPGCGAGDPVPAPDQRQPAGGLAGYGGHGG